MPKGKKRSIEEQIMAAEKHKAELERKKAATGLIDLLPVIKASLKSGEFDVAMGHITNLQSQVANLIPPPETNDAA